MKREVDYAELGQRIKEIRLSKGLTQDNLAEMIGSGVTHISNIENNHTKLSINALLAIANSLDVSIDYLLCNQLNDTESALDLEIMRVLHSCSNDKKRKILKIIDIL